MLSLFVLLPLHLTHPGGDGVAEVLAASALEPAADAGRLAERLRGLGPAALPELFAVLAHGPALGRAPTAVEEHALLAAIEACPRNALREHVRARLAAGADTDERRAFLTALARFATADELGLVRASALAGTESAALSDALEATVGGVLGRDASAVEPVRHWVVEASSELEPPLVRAIAASGSPRTLDLLVALVGYRATLDRLIVPEIGRLLRDAREPAAPEVVATLAELLAGDDAALVREAALALGYSGDFEETGRLVELLEHEHAGVRDGAATALRRLTGLAFGASAQRWRAWHAAETVWLRERGLELRQALRAGPLEDVVHALGELSQRRYRRGELVAEVALVLGHEDARARRLACLALGRLGTRTALAPLRTALEDRHESVRDAARAALRALGEEPPPLPQDGAPQG